MKISLDHKFEDIISLENLLAAWQEFLPGKRRRLDVQLFAARLMDNIFSLHRDLLYHKYRHGGYEAFNISDPKPRNIHKAAVRDRLLHHAIYRRLYPFFDRVFIADSYSCRLGKGTHKAMDRFREYSYKANHNSSRVCWLLKGDIKKFFASIDHDILLSILRNYIPDVQIIELLRKVIDSFNSGRGNKGLPLGNLTSQLFANIYLDKLDQFIKHKIKARYYIRYADDFVILADNKQWLLDILPEIRTFLGAELKLEIHPQKIYLKTLASGVDFLGWVHFPEYRVLRTKTRRRMTNRIKNNLRSGCLDSYLGLLKHGNTHKIKQEVLDSLSAGKSECLHYFSQNIRIKV